jgi:predicted small secreted protein
MFPSLEIAVCRRSVDARSHCRSLLTRYSGVVRLTWSQRADKVKHSKEPANYPRAWPTLRDAHLEKEAVMLRIIAAMLAIAVMAGCNTMAGVGKDVKSVGDSLENSAEKHK